MAASCNSNVYYWVLLLLFPLASGDCIDLDLGMESKAILDSQITASSTKNANTPAKNGRLKYTAGQSWCASTSDSSPHLQIDLKTLHIICAVSTQGNSKSDDWVKTYTLQTSTDGTTWTDYKDVGQAKAFTGNSDKNTLKKNILYEGVLTRWLRFVVKTKHNQYSCMRTEVFGVKYEPENLAAGKTTHQSSTCCDGEAVKAVDGNANTNYDNGHCSHTQENNPSWWRVELGSDHAPVSEVRIVNRFSGDTSIQQRSKDYKITLGDSATVTSNPACIGLYSFIQFIASAVCYRNPLTTGRYLGIMTTKTQILQLCEVEVYSRENLAYNKSTAQISTLASYDAYGGLAVDGNSNSHFFAGKSCTHTNTETNPWWRVNLGKVEHVTEVYIVNRGDCCSDRLNSFEIRVGISSSNGGISNPKCGIGGYSVPGGSGASFFCRPSLYGRYVTIRSIKSVQHPLTLCEVEVYSTRRACRIQSLGLVSRYAFPDSSFSASTSRNGNEAFKCRLNGNGAWSPSTNDNASDYLQINLQYEFFICAVATQGSSTVNHWTKKYKLLLSLNNTDWITYQENNIDKIFNANDGNNDIVKHMLVGVNRARFIRFQPTDYETGKALRVEVYGLLKPAGPSQAPASFSMTPLTSTSVRASWKLPPADSIYGIIIGYKLSYRNKSSAGDPFTVITIGSNLTLTRDVTGLGIYTEYEFQVLAFSSIGNGPRSVQVVRTNEEAPSKSPTSFTVTAASSTSITANWQLPPADSRNGIISGFKLFYKKKNPAGSSTTTDIINDGTTLTKTVTGLDKYTEYELKVLAFTSVGDGPRSSEESERTMEDAPGAPEPLSYSTVAPSVSYGPRINLTWNIPHDENGIIRNYTIFFSHNEGQRNVQIYTFGANIFSYLISALGGESYQFNVRAVTVKPGTNASLSVDVPEYAPTVGPENVTFFKVNGTTFNISWAPLTRDYGRIITYEVTREKLSSGPRSRRSNIDSFSVNSTQTFAVLYDFDLCSKYNVSVRGYTGAGPGVHSRNMALQTSKPGKPSNLTLKDHGDTSVKLEWKQPSLIPEEGLDYTIKYTGKKDYDKEFVDRGRKHANKATTYTLTGLLPGTSYSFEVYGVSTCGESASLTLQNVETDIANPVAPDVNDVSNISVSESSAVVQLWPAKQRNGPISAYQVIVQKAADGVTELPADYSLKLKYSKNASKSHLDFYIAAEMINDPVRKVVWEFTVGDERDYGGYFNSALEKGQVYNVYQRAITFDKNIVLEGEYIKVSKISVAKEPDAPKNLQVKDSGKTEVTLEWEKPSHISNDGLDFTVKYTGKKDYDKEFSDSGTKNAKNATKYTLTDLFPGTSYSFEVYSVSKYGNSLSLTIKVDTDIASPVAPAIDYVIDKSVSTSSAVIQLWPAKQRNGPISVHQVIVLKVADDVEGQLGENTDNSKNVSKGNLNLNIVAEINNDPVREASWEFTIGDKQKYGAYVNNELERRHGYIVYQRAVTRLNNVVFEGKIGKIAKISVTEFEGQHLIYRTAAINLSCIVVLLFLVIGLLIWRRRREHPNNANTPDRHTSGIDGQRQTTHGQQVSAPGIYMELNPRPPVEQSSSPLEYESLQRNASLGYYNAGLNQKNTRKGEEAYEEVGYTAEA